MICQEMKHSLFILDLVDFDLVHIRRIANRHALREAWRSGLTKFSFSCKNELKFEFVNSYL